MKIAIKSRAFWIRLVLVVLAALGIWLAIETLPVLEWAREFIDFVDRQGIWGPVAFFCVYLVISVLGVPRTPFNVSAGIVFSYPEALTVVLVSGLAAFFSTFTISRYLLHDWVRKRVDGNDTMKCLLEMVDDEGFKIVFLVRINPFLPAFLKGYALGSSNISIMRYLVASVLGFLPIAAMHTYLGWVGGHAMMESENQPEELKWLVIIGGAVLSVALVAVLTWYGQRTLKKKRLSFASAS